MSYCLREDETLADGIRRICREQIADALAASIGQTRGGDSPAHQTRKHIKKTRAALRLVADAIGSACFKRENHCLRDVGRLVSQIRDAEVRLKTVEQLRDLSKAPKNAFLNLEQLLALELDSFGAAFSDWHRTAKPRLTHLRGRMSGWPLDQLDCKCLRRAVHKSYQRGHRALKSALKKRTTENVHMLRKRVKDLWYQLRILRELHPLVTGELADELNIIGQNLGGAHDMSLLADRVQKIANDGRTRGEARCLSGLTEVRRKQLEGTAVELANHFYAEQPKHFSERISTYFEKWETGKLRSSRGKGNARKESLSSVSRHSRSEA
jgi:CHAD domain-containing protein